MTTSTRRSFRPRHFVLGFVSGVLTGFMFTALTLAAALAVFFATGLSLVNGTEFTVAELNVGRSVGEIREDTKAFIRSSKQTDDWSLQVGAVVDLCSLHHEIVNDPRYPTNTRLQSFRAQIADRLKKYKRELNVLIVRRERKQQQAQKELEKLAKSQSPDSDFAPELLSDGPKATHDDLEWDRMLDQSVYQLSQLTGGPVEVLRRLPGQFAPPWDHGEDLVNLIESTIHPDTWRRNGGEGRIKYYRPSRVLVVSASMRVQDDLTDTLRKLRFLSR